MAKKKIREHIKTWGEMIQTLPILLIVSLTANVIVIAFLLYARTDGMTQTVLNYAQKRACVRNYDYLKANTGRTKDWAYLSEQECHRNYLTGTPIKGWVTQDGMYSSASK
jgi:cell division protein FtsB